MNQESSIQYSRSEEFKKWTNELVESPRSFDIPDQYTNILREYQVDGYQWLRLMEHYGFGGILADDMGLGKTLQMIVYLESVKSQGTHMVVNASKLVVELARRNRKICCSYEGFMYLWTKTCA